MGCGLGWASKVRPTAHCWLDFGPGVRAHLWALRSSSPALEWAIPVYVSKDAAYVRNEAPRPLEIGRGNSMPERLPTSGDCRILLNGGIWKVQWDNPKFQSLATNVKSAR